MAGIDLKTTFYYYYTPDFNSPSGSCVNTFSSVRSLYEYTAVPVYEIRKLDHFVNRTCVRFTKQSFANQYWLVYEAITK